MIIRPDLNTRCPESGTRRWSSRDSPRAWEIREFAYALRSPAVRPPSLGRNDLVTSVLQWFSANDARGGMGQVDG
jgi:hypothetical protein